MYCDGWVLLVALGSGGGAGGTTQMSRGDSRWDAALLRGEEYARETPVAAAVDDVDDDAGVVAGDGESDVGDAGEFCIGFESGGVPE